MKIKRLWVCLTALVLLISCLMSCGQINTQGTEAKNLRSSEAEVSEQSYQFQYFDYFDTVSTVTLFVPSRREADAFNDWFTERLKYWHQLLDNFRAYDGVVNVYTLNQKAGHEAVSVNEDLLKLLEFAIDMAQRTEGKTNVAMGAVFSLWQKERELASTKADFQGQLPDTRALAEAAKHSVISALEIDHRASTVRFADDKLQLDLGAIGKGYICFILQTEMKQKGYENVLLNLGGNLCALGTRGGKAWRLGIGNPLHDPNIATDDLLDVVEARDFSIISSGNYERFYKVGDKRYHHIIDPETLFPSDYFVQVTILSPNPAWGDALSTALFNGNQAYGERILAQFPDTAACWLDKDGQTYYSANWKAVVEQARS